MNQDEQWMRYAISEAKKAQSKSEIPVGCVIVENNIIIAKAHNQLITNNDPTAHAEILALRKAGKRNKNYRLIDSTLYVTLEPCAMCFSAMVHARIKRIVFGAFDPKTGVCGSSENLIGANCFNHKINLASGVLENESKQLLKNFFISRR